MDERHLETSAPDVDVVVVGGGLAGCVAAAALQKLGRSVVVIDRTARPRPEFRAEQMVGPQISKLRTLGVIGADACLRATTATLSARRGALLDRTVVEQIGLPYHTMVENARGTLRPDTLRAGRVVAVDASPTLQTVTLAGGGVIRARLVVVATGLVPQLLDTLGVRRPMVSAAHSLCLGFDVELARPRAAPSLSLVYYGEHVASRVDYLAVFPMVEAIRGNLFCYYGRSDEWTNAFVAEPTAALRRALPNLHRLVGEIAVAGRVEMRSNDIRVATDVVRDGLVLVGDAFQTPCPAAGTGIDRILSDVEALLRHAPRWFDHGRFGAAEVATFYDDPLKRAFDAECLRIARYRRAVSTESGVGWRAHRRRVQFQRQVAATIQRRLQRLPQEAADPAGPTGDGQRVGMGVPLR